MITPYSNIISVTTEKFPFEFTVKTDNAGVSTSTQFRMPLTTSTGLDIDVDWGDGSPIENITVHTNAIHTYAAAGTYTIKVLGSLLGWRFANGGDRLKMLNVASWGALNISVDSAFNGCTNLTCTATDAPLITSTNLFRCFSGCTNFNGAIGNWDISNVTSLQEMFRSCTNFNQYIGDWNTSLVTNLQSTFAITSLFNQDLSTKIVNVGQPNEYVAWDTSNVTNMLATFYFTDSFNGNVDNWNTSSVLNMQQMFGDAIAFNRDVSRKTINLGQPNEYEAWNTSNVTDMYSLFGSDFTRTCIFNQNIGNWITTSVTRMAFMFARNTSFNQDIGSWNVSNVTNFTNFMANKSAANYLASNLDSIYNGWSSRPVQPNISISFGSIKYTAAGVSGRAILTSAPNNWTITDGGI